MSRIHYLAVVIASGFAVSVGAQPTTQTCPNGAVVAATATCPDDSEPSPAVSRTSPAIARYGPATPHKIKPRVTRPATTDSGDEIVAEPEVARAPAVEPAPAARSSVAPAAPASTHEDTGLLAALRRYWMWLAGGFAALAVLAAGLWLVSRRVRQDR